MKLVVLNGSPKQDLSVTMQYVQYIQIKYPDHDYVIFHITSELKKISNDPRTFDAIMEQISQADGVLWAFPVYYMLVPSGYKSFIELIDEKNAHGTFRGKYTAVLSTSIHFYDYIAHNYLRSICDDWEMRYVNYFSADMYDLMDPSKRRQLYLFASEFMTNIEQQYPTTRVFKKLENNSTVYIPGWGGKTVDTKGKKVVIVTDCTDSDTNIGKMIKRFAQFFLQKPLVVNISELNIKGGCLGCIHCGFDNECVYDGKDEIRKTYEEILEKSDIIVYAGTIVDRYLSSTWKLFIDRRFYNTHRRMYSGKQFGFLISGPLSDLPNLREMLQAYVEVDNANLVDIITDEYDASNQIDALLEKFAFELVRCSVESCQKPATSLGVFGIRLFRDEIWGRLRLVFQGDHKHFKKNGIYDFPHQELFYRFINSMLILLSKFPPVRRDMKKRISWLIINAYRFNSFKKVLDKEKALPTKK